MTRIGTITSTDFILFRSISFRSIDYGKHAYSIYVRYAAFNMHLSIKKRCYSMQNIIVTFVMPISIYMVYAHCVMWMCNVYTPFNSCKMVLQAVST